MALRASLPACTSAGRSSSPHMLLASMASSAAGSGAIWDSSRWLPAVASTTTGWWPCADDFCSQSSSGQPDVCSLDTFWDGWALLQPAKGQAIPRSGCIHEPAGEAKSLQHPVSPSATTMTGRCSPLAARICGCPRTWIICVMRPPGEGRLEFTGLFSAQMQTGRHVRHTDICQATAMRPSSRSELLRAPFPVDGAHRRNRLRGSFHSQLSSVRTPSHLAGAVA